jgi:hypothetical protein
MIEKTSDITDFDRSNVPVLKNLLDDICRQAVGSAYTDSTSKATEMAAQGMIVVYDNGTDRRVYMKTDKGSVGYITLTIV